MATTKTGLSSLLESLTKTLVSVEAGTHSPWASRYVVSLGHDVIVANPRRLQLISDSKRKNDRIDAEKLARLAQFDPKLLTPIQHRGEQAQLDLGRIRARDVLVSNRTGLVNAARGQAKSPGYRLADCDADSVGTGLTTGPPQEVKDLSHPLLETAAQLTAQIKAADQRIHTRLPSAIRK